MYRVLKVSHFRKDIEEPGYIKKRTSKIVEIMTSKDLLKELGILGLETED